jgi:hypothetical protein
VEPGALQKRLGEICRRGGSGAGFRENCLSLRWLVSGVLRLWAGQSDIAIEHVEASLRLGPRDRVGLSFLAIGAAHFFARRFEEAVPKLLIMIQEDPSLPSRIQASRRRINFSPPAMPIWVGSTMHERSSSG